MFYSFTDKLLFKCYFYHMAFKEERSIEQSVYHSRFALAISEEVTNLP